MRRIRSNGNPPMVAVTIVYGRTEFRTFVSRCFLLWVCGVVVVFVFVFVKAYCNKAGVYLVTRTTSHSSSFVEV